MEGNPAPLDALVLARRVDLFGGVAASPPEEGITPTHDPPPSS